MAITTYFDVPPSRRKTPIELVQMAIDGFERGRNINPEDMPILAGAMRDVLAALRRADAANTLMVAAGGVPAEAVQQPAQARTKEQFIQDYVIARATSYTLIAADIQSAREAWEALYGEA
jgi:hypothetical protein